MHSGNRYSPIACIKITTNNNYYFRRRRRKNELGRHTYLCADGFSLHHLHFGSVIDGLHAPLHEVVVATVALHKLQQSTHARVQVKVKKVGKLEFLRVVALCVATVC